MALTVTSSLENSYTDGSKNRRLFDSYAELSNVDNWSFQYETLNMNNRPWRPGDIEQDDATAYPKGTIFFDSNADDVGIAVLSSSIENIIIDTAPPKFVSENIQYLTFASDHKCEFTFQSETLLDVAQLAILCGNDPIYYCNRKKVDQQLEIQILDLKYSDTDIKHVPELKNMAITKNGDNYTLSFALSRYFGDDILNANQITVIVWDIAGNKAIHTTSGKWKTIDKDNFDMEHLIIDFISIEPESKIITQNVEGRVKVRIVNPNPELWDILPTFRLCDDSIGVIEEASIDYSEYATTGVVTFYVIHINKGGYVTVEAWIDIDNTELKEVMKNSTYAKASLGPWIFGEEGRKYKLMSYVPTYLNDETYNNFVKFVQDFLNTSQKSLTTGNAISTLEKTARINNFNDVFRVEQPLLNYYQKQYNIEINPALENYVYYLKHRETR